MCAIQNRYGRIVATCLVDDKDIAEVMVRAGYGFAFRRYSKAYVTAERDARGDQVEGYGPAGSSILGIGGRRKSDQAKLHHRWLSLSAGFMRQSLVFL